MRLYSKSYKIKSSFQHHWGVACAPQDGTDLKQLCRKADIAMYQAKQDGRKPRAKNHSRRYRR
ncbi:diguanylate cyclase [uncultured Paraglaciecola sp.]|uniref:diguanylate cyclase domain-containing protein n=1 Tax=uncultured Paraglaciecola sp. TaxID=1765024 RepID=UPI00263827A3|nr:diguanylate cyclase [uncultured Paraglaciecola sp.]